MAYVANYNQILDDAKALIETNITAFKAVYRNARIVDMNRAKFPCVDLRLTQGSPEARAMNAYYTTVVLEYEIAANDLSLRSDAATIVLDLLAQLQALFVANPRFCAFIDSAILGPFEAVAAEDPEKEGSFVASATGQILISFYAQ